MSTPLPVPPQGPDELDDGPVISLLDLITWLGEGKRFIGAVTGVAIVVAVTVALLRPNVYTARTTLIPPNSQQQSSSSAALAALGSLGGMTGVAGSLGGKTPDEMYVSLLKSDTVYRALAKRFDLHKHYDIEHFEDLRKVLPTYIRISADKKSGVITVEVDDKDPKFAADLANAHSAEITKLLSRLTISEAQQRRVFFEQQLKDTKENLIQAEQALRRVQEQSGMVVLDKQAEAIIKSAGDLKARIAEREVKLKVLRTSATAANPDVQMLNSELQALHSELARMESATHRPTGKTGGVDIPVGGLPAAAVDYARAMREVKFQETMLAGMLRQYEAAKLDVLKDAPALQQVDVALPPDRKSKPARAVIVLTSTLLALLGASLWVIMRRYSRAADEQNPERAQAFQALKKAWRWRRETPAA